MAGISEVLLRAYGNLPEQICSPGQPVLFPQAGTDVAHSFPLPKHIATLIKAAGFHIQLPVVTPLWAGASSTVTHQRPFRSLVVTLSINQRWHFLPPHLAAQGAGAISTAARLPALNHTAALPSAGLPCLPGAHRGPATETQLKGMSSSRSIWTPSHSMSAARPGASPPNILLQPLQGGPQGVPTPKLLLQRVVTLYQCQYPCWGQQPFRVSLRVVGGDTSLPAVLATHISFGGGLCVSTHGPFGSQSSAPRTVGRHTDI